MNEEIIGKIVEEVIESDTFKEWAVDLLKDIKDGRKGGINNDRPYGFGEGCYYKSKSDATEDYVCQILDNGLSINDIVDMKSLSSELLRIFGSRIEITNLFYSLKSKDIRTLYDTLFDGSDIFNDAIADIAKEASLYVKKNNIDGITRYESEVSKNDSTSSS